MRTFIAFTLFRLSNFIEGLTLVDYSEPAVMWAIWVLWLALCILTDLKYLIIKK
jgi:hypothetical protein